MSFVNVQEHDFDLKHFLQANGEGYKNICIASEACRGHVLKAKRKKLAIIFVPGIMASRLTNFEGDMVWDPDSAWTMLPFLFAGPETRQKLLLTDPPLSPPPKNKRARQGNVPKRFPHAIARGWHTVSWTYYGALLQSLEEWATPLKAFIEMEVHAFGYDWLQSNWTSGRELCGFIDNLEEDVKVILVSHSMGGLVCRACLKQLQNKDKVLGVIHGAQPAMGAPAAYRRQKAGFEAHTFFEGITSLALGKDGPNVRAIFPYGFGPLELLPCASYHDPNFEKGWFSYTAFDANGNPRQVHIPSEEIYEKVYIQYDSRCYYGMLNSEEFLNGMESLKGEAKKRQLREPYKDKDLQDDPASDINNDVLLDNVPEEYYSKSILKAATFHNKKIKNISHPRTVQLFSKGKPTCCAVHWKGEDVTEKILACDFEPQKGSLNILHADENIRRIIPAPIDGGNDYYELRWLETDWSVGECILTPRKGKFIDGKTIQREIKASKRHVALFTLTHPRMIQPNAAPVAGDGAHKVDDGETHWDYDGDGTVPVASVVGLSLSKDGWPDDLKDTLPVYTAGPTSTSGGTHIATLLTSDKEHSQFFDDAAIQATRQVIHNLCVAWLKGDIT